MNVPKSTSRLPPLWPRIALAMLPVLLIVLAVIVDGALQTIDRQLENDDTVRLTAIAQRVVPTLRERVDVADAWVVGRGRRQCG